MLFYQTAILEIIGVDASKDSLRSSYPVSEQGWSHSPDKAEGLEEEADGNG